MFKKMDVEHIIGSTPSAIKRMFRNRQINTFDEVMEIEYKRGTMTCCFRDNKCYQVLFFSDEGDDFQPSWCYPAITPKDHDSTTRMFGDACDIVIPKVS